MQRSQYMNEDDSHSQYHKEELEEELEEESGDNEEEKEEENSPIRWKQQNTGHTGHTYHTEENGCGCGCTCTWRKFLEGIGDCYNTQTQMIRFFLRRFKVPVLVVWFSHFGG